MATSGVRLTELLVALSLATDLGLGQPPEHMLRSTRISLRLGARLGLSSEQLATLYDVSLLTYVGCPVHGNEAALLFGDDIDFRSGTYDVDLAGRAGMTYMLRRAVSDAPLPTRVRRVASLLGSGGRGVVEQMAGHCSAAGLLADRLGLGPEVRAGVEQSYARWDGRGVPDDLAGDSLALPARVAQVADACEVLHRRSGVQAAVEVVRSRSGTHFDPEVVRALASDPSGVFDGLDDATVDEVLDAEPVERPALTEQQLDTALAAIGDFCDLRCSYFAGHAAGTAALAAGAAGLLHLSPADTTLVRRAAWVHDVGRFGVPASVWDKPGALSGHELERARMHTYYVERIFHRPEPLRRIGLLAGSHHERMDGSGYHRGTGGALLSSPARVLGAADSYHAMTQTRPHRPARSAAEVARELRAEVRAGRLDAVAVEAVVAAAGDRSGRPQDVAPAGLTAREVQVLGLLSTGLANKAIARRLGITPKTVGNHVEHIYTKLGVSNRAGAAVLAMRHGLVGSTAAAGTSDGVRT